MPLPDDVRTRLVELEQAATPGPWEVGVAYWDAGVNDGSHKDWSPPLGINPGECCFCKNADATLVRAFAGEKGTMHRHRVPRDADDWHDIGAAEATGGAITGIYDYEEGGVCSKAEDAKLIAEARNNLPTLLASDAWCQKAAKLLGAAKLALDGNHRTPMLLVPANDVAALLRDVEEPPR